jgi:hypothetical protein
MAKDPEGEAERNTGEERKEDANDNEEETVLPEHRS